MSHHQDRVILITGASSGIGAACARKFAADRASLILLARREERLQTVAEEVQRLGASMVHTIAADVRDRQALAEGLERIPTERRTIDTLINNAGLSRGLDPLHEGKFEDWDEMLDTNIKGLLNVDRLVVPGMVERRSGTVIHIGSIAGREVYPKGNVYCASKHAVAALTKGLRLDLTGSGVRVCTVDPGLVETEFSEVRFRGDKKLAKTAYTGMQPLTAEDIAEAVHWVAARPPGVQIAELLILPTDQASATCVHRRT